jgi:hypothetical protein
MMNALRIAGAGRLPGDCAHRLMSPRRECVAFEIFGHCPVQWPKLRKVPEYYA